MYISYFPLFAFILPMDNLFNFTNALQTSIASEPASPLVPDFFLHPFLLPISVSFYENTIYLASVRQYRSTVAFLVHSAITSRSPVKDL